ncbi:MAG TPA: NDP-sugar synthase [Candidatus Stackebrandtia faecavium]|nr:NDP-sugar synthase [Candidatus Stackebrandtia faecavium]
MQKHIKGLILAAGLGTRLAPFTDLIPKPLFPVLNRPIIVHVIERLRACGITEVGINVHHLADDIITFLGDGSDHSVRITWFKEDELLGTGGILKHCADFWTDCDLLVTAGDMLSTMDLASLVDFHRGHDGDATVATFEHAWPLNEWGGDVAVLEPDSTTVIEYQSKPRSDARSRFGCTGTWVFSPTVQDAMPESRQFDLNEHLLPRLVGGRLHAYADVYEFADMGSPEVYLVGTGLAMRGELGVVPDEPATREGLYVNPTADVPSSVRITGPVLIGEGVRIGELCEIVGPTVVGGGCVVGDEVSLRNSVLLPGTYVPANTVVVKGLLGNAATSPMAIRRHCLRDHRSTSYDGSNTA